jgi:hypothetical protein|tara:strand:+ start:68 stop:355 length:288 start_codon:yes stop_codon:yes gene_type:complete
MNQIKHPQDCFYITDNNNGLILGWADGHHQFNAYNKSNPQVSIRKGLKWLDKSSDLYDKLRMIVLCNLGWKYDNKKQLKFDYDILKPTPFKSILD